MVVATLEGLSLVVVALQGGFVFGSSGLIRVVCLWWQRSYKSGFSLVVVAL